MADAANIPPSGTACAPCQRNGHFCRAHQYLDGEPLCIFCLDEEECPETAKRRRDQVRQSKAPPPPPDPDPDPEPEPTKPQPPQKESPAMKKASKETKKCAAEGCKFNASPRGSYCTYRHINLLKRERAGSVVVPAKRKTRRPSVKPEAAPAREEEKPSTHSVSVALTEAECDRLFGRCTHRQKAIALGAILRFILAAEESVEAQS